MIMPVVSCSCDSILSGDSPLSAGHEEAQGCAWEFQAPGAQGWCSALTVRAYMRAHPSLPSSKDSRCRLLPAGIWVSVLVLPRRVGGSALSQFQKVVLGSKGDGQPNANEAPHL